MVNDRRGRRPCICLHTEFTYCICRKKSSYSSHCMYIERTAISISTVKIVVPSPSVKIKRRICNTVILAMHKINIDDWRWRKSERLTLLMYIYQCHNYDYSATKSALFSENSQVLSTDEPKPVNCVSFSTDSRGTIRQGNVSGWLK